PRCSGTSRSRTTAKKVRWALDYKGIAHRRRVLGPDYLIPRLARDAPGQAAGPVARRPGHRRFDAHHRRGRRVSPPTWRDGVLLLAFQMLPTRLSGTQKSLSTRR